jgi:hypothetical protein
MIATTATSKQINTLNLKTQDAKIVQISTINGVRFQIKINDRKKPIVFGHLQAFA